MSDARLAAVAPALQAGGSRSVAARTAAEILAEAQGERRLRDRIFAPLAPAVRAAGAEGSALLPPDTLFLLWRVLQAEAPAEAAQALRAADDVTDPDRARRSADALSALAAARLGDDPRWGVLREALDARRAGAAETLRMALLVSPLARSAAPKLKAWMRTASSEQATALRLAYRDAGRLFEEAPPLLLELLTHQLDARWQVLRLISAVMDRPSDAFLAASELGRFGEAVLDDVDAQIQQVRAFEPAGGPAAGQAAAAAACAAASALAEFDRSVELGPGGPWNKRIAAQRRNLSRGVETRLRQADGVLAKALPVVVSRTPGRLRGGPRLDVPMEPLAKTRAEALLAFVEGVRAAADGGGFATVRSAVVEKLDQRLAVYADDLVAIAHDGDPEEAQEARARLPFLADCLGRVRDPRAAAVVRRRAAAA